jgi:replicative DNA helicase Mcm
MLAVIDIIKNLVQQNNGEPVKVEEVISEAEKRGIDQVFVKKVIDKLLDNGEIMTPRPGYITVVTL